MSLKFIGQPAYDLKYWFSTADRQEGWWDQEYTTGTTTNAFTLSAVQGTYVETGVAATKAISSAEITGIYTVSGKADTMNSARSISTVKGTYTLTGNAETSTRGINIAATKGSYNLTGIADTSQISTAVAQGSYVVNGIASTFPVTRKLSAITGVYVVNGTAETNPISLSILLSTGSYLVIGKDTSLNLSPFNADTTNHSLPFLVTIGPLTAR